MTDIQKRYINNIIGIAQRIYHINYNIEPTVTKYVNALDLSDPMMLHVPISALADNIIKQLNVNTNHKVNNQLL